MAPYILFSFLFHVAAFYALGELSVAVVTFHSVPMDFYIVDRVPRGVDAGVPAKTASPGEAKKKTAGKKPPQTAKAVKKIGGGSPGKSAAIAGKSSFAKTVVPVRDIPKGAAQVDKPSEALGKQEARAGEASNKESRPAAAAVANDETFGIEPKKAAIIEEKPSLKEVAVIIKDEEATRVATPPALAAAIANDETFGAESKKATAIEEKPSLKEVAVIIKGEEATRVVVRPTPEVTVSVTMKGSQKASWARSGSEDNGAAAPGRAVIAPSGYEDIYYMPFEPLRPERLLKKTVNQDAPSVERDTASAKGAFASVEPAAAKSLPVEEHAVGEESSLGTEKEAGKQPGEEDKAGDAPFPYDRFTISYPDDAVAPRHLQYSLETETFSDIANVVFIESEELPEAALAESLPVEEYAADKESSLGTEEEDKAGDAPFPYDRFAISYLDDAVAPRRLEYFLEIETSLDIANVISIEPGEMPEAAVAEEYSILDALFPGSSSEEESLGILAAVITPESATPSNEEYMGRVEAEAKLPAKGDGTQSGNLAVLATPGEIVIIIESRGDAEGLRFGLFKKPHPMMKIRRGGNAQIAAQSVSAGEGPKKSVFEFEMADKAVYTFRVENKGAASRVFSVEFRLRGGRLKLYKEVSLGTEEAKSFKFLMPEAVFWDDEERFSGSIEGADSVTKFDDASGLVWKEEK